MLERGINEIRDMSDEERKDHYRWNFIILSTLILMCTSLLILIYHFKDLIYPYTVSVWIGVTIICLWFISYHILYCRYYSTEYGHGDTRSIRDTNKFSLSSVDISESEFTLIFVICYSIAFGIAIIQSNGSPIFHLNLKYILFSIPFFLGMLIHLVPRHHVRVMKDYLGWEY